VSIRAYLAIVFGIYLGYFAGIVMILGGPQAAMGDAAGNFLFKLPLGAAAMTLATWKFARETPPESRTGFWSFRSANFSIALLFAVTVVMLISVLGTK